MGLVAQQAKRVLPGTGRMGLDSLAEQAMDGGPLTLAHGRNSMRLGSICLMVAAIAMLTCGEAAAVIKGKAPALAGPSIQGAWELVWPEKGAHERQIKLITPTHFTWTDWDTESHRVLGCGGGGYTLVGNSYCEQLLFAQGGIEEQAGFVLCFRVEVRGDTLLQLGPPDADGARSREVWKRLR